MVHAAKLTTARSRGNSAGLKRPFEVVEVGFGRGFLRFALASTQSNRTPTEYRRVDIGKQVHSRYYGTDVKSCVVA